MQGAVTGHWLYRLEFKSEQPMKYETIDLLIECFLATVAMRKYLSLLQQIEIRRSSTPETRRERDASTRNVHSGKQK